MQNEEPRLQYSKRALVALMAGGCIVAAVLIYYFHRQQLTWVREEQGRALLTIADVKTAAIASWRQERMGDARGVPLNTPFAAFLREYLAKPAAPATEKEIRDYFKVLTSNHDYTAILLFDANAKLRLSSDPISPAAARDASLLAHAAIVQGKVIFEDFHGGVGDPVHLAVVGPVRDASSSVVAAILFRIDPARFLYPQIQAWPTFSESGETLLVRREGSEIVYLNELRHQHGTALNLRLPVDHPQLIAAMAVAGKKGLVEGIDYRGVPVMAAVRRIPDSPWFLITKIDRAEAYERVHSRTRYFAVITLLVLMLSGFSLLLAWSRRESEHYRRSISQRERAEREIRRLNSVLEERVRHRTVQLEAVNQELEAFSYSVSHDLRAPLRGIEGWSLALVEDYADILDGRGRQYLERVRSETQRMGMLIDDLLQLSRVTRGEMKRDVVDLTGLAQSIAARIREAQPARELEFVIHPGLNVQGDARLLEVALTNLLENAAKFTVSQSHARIEVGRRNNEGQETFYVRDNGVGFDMQYAGTLFGAFQRLHKTSEFPGTGIGLTTVQRVISRHGGRVWADAQPECGATFYFTVPSE